MEFDKKTILAFLLIGLILVLVNTDYYQRFVFGDLKKSAPAPRDLPVPASPSLADSLEYGMAEQAVEEPLTFADSLRSDRRPERTIAVATPLYHATFSTRGGGPTRWQVNDFVDQAGQPVVLFEHGAGNFALGLPLEDDSLDTAELDFDCAAGDLSLAPGETGELVFARELAPGSIIRKTYMLAADSYTLKVKVELLNLRELISGYHYTLAWRTGLLSTEKNVKDDMSDTKAYTHVGEEVIDLDVGDKPRVEKAERDRDITWAAVRTKYFTVAIVPRTQPARGVQLAGRTQSMSPGDNARLKSYAMALSMPVALQGESTIHEFDLYAGPLVYENVKAFGVDLEEIMNLGWGPIKPFSKAVLWSLVWLHKFIANYGLVIVVFSLLVKVILHPLTKKSYESMKQMQALQPRMAELRQKYGDDAKKMNEEMMRLYKEYGVNPLGGCLPMLLQMPLLYALFIVFRSTIEFRQAPFFGWITDLSAPDAIFQLPFSLPLYGSTVNVLPLVMGVTMFIQQKMSTTDPKQKAMIYIMPVLFTMIFNSFPSGLNLYYTLFNVLSIMQQAWIAKAPAKPQPKKKSNKFSLAQIRRMGVNAALSRNRAMKR